MAFALHTPIDNLFHHHGAAFHDGPASLANEAFPGELALLREQASRHDQLIDVMPTGLIMLDGNGVVIKINKVARQLLDEPILGQPWFDVIGRSFKPRADDWHEVSLNDGRRVKLEITTLGNQPGQLIMITDLTETRLLQDNMAQLQRLSSLGRMVSSLAHQIRTPLSAAMLYGANLSNASLSRTVHQNFQGKLMGRLQDLEQQVNDMLLFAKSGDQQVVESLSVNDVVNTSMAAMEALVSQANAQVEVISCQHDCEILGNINALTGAIQNLVQNSLQVIKHDAKVVIETQCKDGYALISVRDNGPGIDVAKAEKIFEPFYTSKVQGTGLGLAVVKTVAEAHQGKAYLINQPGQGAKFCIQLPLIESKSSIKVKQVPSANQSQEIAYEHQ
jgi:two-component system sensor histidine kinase FlrB